MRSKTSAAFLGQALGLLDPVIAFDAALEVQRFIDFRDIRLLEAGNLVIVINAELVERFFQHRANVILKDVLITGRPTLPISGTALLLPPPAHITLNEDRVTMLVVDHAPVPIGGRRQNAVPEVPEERCDRSVVNALWSTEM